MEDDDFADVYYIDTRNATRDHRPPGRPWFRPNRPPIRHVPAPRPVPRAPQAYPAYAEPVYAQPQPVFYGQPGASGAAALFGRLTTGQIVEMIAQGFAAMQSLPGAPIATRDLETDIANMVLYQSALASHAKRDEQWRTLGGLVAKLVG